MFFRSMNFEILEAYGMTEAGPLITVNKMGKARIGTVGEFPPEIDGMIADDGEIMVKGPSIMKGYWRRPDADRDTFKDGWLATGDIGRISDDGYLRITDRKKNLIKTSNGKYVPPAPIEDKLISNQFISQAMVVGDARPHCSAIIVPDFRRLEDYAQKNKIHYTSLDELTKHPTVCKFYDDLVAEETKGFANHEQPKKVILGSREWTWETGELTPTQKVRRTVITKLFKEDIDRAYSTC
jgi:long-chain acyl-CoA synthetase